MIGVMRQSVFLTLVLALVSLVLLPPGLIPAGADVVLIADLDKAITPVTATYVERVIREARAVNAKAVLFRLDTPGGLMESTRHIVREFLNSEIPILVWIGPSGARAASAGVFITYASHISAMAGGTHLGAAHPVMLGGDKMEAVMKQKAENDAAAWARTIAETRRRNVVFAESAVRESTSLTDKVALDSGAIDLRADSIDSFLAMIAGETTSVAGPGRKQIALQIKSVELRTVEPKLKEKVLAFLTDPNVVYVLILLAMAGIYFEFSTPGVGVPGVVGVLSLILAAYGLSILPVNTVGLILMVVGIGLMLLDIKVASHGILTAGGIVSMAIGGLMLFEDKAFRVSFQVILLFTAMTAAFVVFAVGAAVRAFHTKVRVGEEVLSGMRGEVRTPLNPVGHVLVDGELWSAHTEDGAALDAGTAVSVIRKDGVQLIVRRLL